MDRLKATRAKIASLNRKLQPLAARPVDLEDPNWMLGLRTAPSPLDEAGVRAEAEAALARILDVYSADDPPARVAIRQLVAENGAFARATSVPSPRTTAQGFRQHLLWLSAIDQSQDVRDTIVTVHELCRTAKAAGVDTAPILSEVAELSSDDGDTRMGSLKTILRRFSLT